MALTPSAISKINNEELIPEPVVQILNVKKINTQSDTTKPNRYRLHVSDGVHKHLSAMLATQLNGLVENGELKKHSLVKLKKYLCNTVGGRKIIIILQADIVQSDYPNEIGNPQPVGKEEENQQGNQDVKPMTTKPASASVNPYAARVTNAAPRSAPTGITQTAQPINSLNPYNPRWAIKARITKKSNMREWQNAKGSGKLFSVDMLDESGEMRGTAFNDAADKLFGIFEVGKVYFIKGGRIKPANKRYSALNNDYEITFDDNTIVTLDDTKSAIPQQKFHFVDFNTLSTMPCENTFIDVLGICTNASPLTTITTRTTKRDVSKMDITLLDRNSISVQCTLWGADAEEFESKGGSVGCVVGVKNARLSDFNGRSLSASSNSQVMYNPDVPEAHELKGWYESEGKDTESKALTVQSTSSNRSNPVILISQIKDDKIGQGKDAEYFNVKGAITFIRKENCMYQACPSSDCNKKVIEEGPGSYHCEKCQKTTPNFEYRLMMSFSFSDSSGQQWITAFQEVAEKMLGVTAEELGRLKETDEQQFDNVIAQATFKTWIITCRAKSEFWNGDQKTRVSAVRITPIDFAAESRRLVRFSCLGG